MDLNSSSGTAVATKTAAFALGSLFVAAALGVPVLAFRFGIPILGYALAACWLLLAFALIRMTIFASLRRGVAAILVAAACLRAAALPALGGLPADRMGNDYAAYLMLARNLTEGSGLLAHTMNFGWVRGLYPPLYPILLAGAGTTVGFNATAVFGLNCAIDLASAYLLYVIGRRLGDARVGLAAAALFLIWPSATITAPLPQKEGLVTLLALFIALIFHRMLTDGPGWRNAALLGIGTALMALTQPSLALLPVSIGLVLLPLVGPRSLILFGTRALPFAVMAMLPWWVRNYHLFGTFVPLTTSIGPAMMSAATGLQGTRPQMFMTGDEPMQSALMAQEAGRLIMSNPFGFAGKRILQMVRQMIFEDYDALRLARFTPPISWAHMLLPATQLSFAGAAGLAFAALARKTVARDAFPAILAVASLLHIALFNTWFEFGERHRHFMTPFLLLLAASFVARTLSALPARQSDQKLSSA